MKKCNVESSAVSEPLSKPLPETRYLGGVYGSKVVILEEERRWRN